MPVRVTVLVSTLVVGGAEQLLLDLLRCLDRDRVAVSLVFLRDPGPIGREVMALGLPAEHNVLRSRFDLTAPWRLASILKRQRTDVLLILNHFNALGYGVPAARLARVPAVVNWHHETKRRYPFHVLAMLLRRLLHLGVDRVVAVARGHKDYVVDAEGVPARKVTVIYNAVDVTGACACLSPDDARRALDLPPGTPTVAIVAALRPDKAHEIFLQAAKRVLANHPDARFLIAGDGPRREELETLASSLGIADAVRFLGFRRDIPNILAASDVVALSSYPWQETFSVAMLEAMAAGIPVVVTNVGFLDEIVRDGENGFLVPPGDAPALAAKIGLLLGDAALRTRMGETAQRAVRKLCGRDTMTQGFESLFQELPANRHAS